MADGARPRGRAELTTRMAIDGIGRSARAVLILVLCAPLLAGCGESPGELVAREKTRVAAKIAALGRMIDAGRLTNVRIIGTYADAVGRERPRLADLTGELRKEATTGGLNFTNLGARLAAVNAAPRGEAEANRALDGILRVEAAADPVVFNDSLVDVVNVLADLSGGKLARVEGAAREKPAAQGAGSHLVGNPAYGSWRRDGTGRSFWEWYGAYALFRDVFWRAGRYYHDDWYPRRGWSYYGDVGRNYYGSRADQRRWGEAARRHPDVPRKTYRNLRSERRLSTYGRSDARGAAKTTRRASSYSGYGASVRGAGGSRFGGWRGK